MKKVVKKLAYVLGALVLAAAALGLHTWYAKPLKIDWFYTRVFAQFALDNPELLTQMRLLEPLGIRGHNAKWADSSIAQEDRQFQKLRENLANLKSYDMSGEKGQDRLSYDILSYFLDQQVSGEKWRFHGFPINQMSGAHTGVANLLIQSQQVNDETDAEHYIARMNGIPGKLDQVLEQVRLSESKGVVPPKFAVEKSIEQIRQFLAPKPEANSLVLALKEKLSKVPAAKMSDDRRNALLANAQTAVATNVIPGYQKVMTYLETLLKKATRNDGAWSLPDGEAYYNQQIELHTTTKMKAGELHDTGLKEVDRIGVQMDRILTQAGYVEGARAEKIAKLSASPEQLYPDSADGRAQILKDYQAIIDEFSGTLDKHFGIKPKASVQVKRMAEFSEEGAPGAYYNPPPMDGSKPGTFYANLRDVKATPKFGMRTLAYHEAIPGHHMQIAIAQELKGLPIFRNVVPFTAYAEGWALYSEQLAWELGFQKNPLDDLGRLQAEMFRAVRLVVDTGIHAKRWTREQAIDYMVSNTGMDNGEVVSEIERYFVNPGQALAYKVGMLKMLELRERAKNKLGAKFDLREFHDEVLKNGSLPLAILETVVDQYIQRKLAQPS
jgi:uncharacterized protein (DUF885 family)